MNICKNCGRLFDPNILHICGAVDMTAVTGYQRTSTSVCISCGQAYADGSLHLCNSLRLVLQNYPELQLVVPNGTSLMTLLNWSAALQGHLLKIQGDQNAFSGLGN